VLGIAALVVSEA